MKIIFVSIISATLLFSCNSTETTTTEIINSDTTEIEKQELPTPFEYVLSNEEVVFGFDTEDGKTIMLLKDAKGDYLTFRMGTATDLELEFPSVKTTSWDQFEYSFYFRGGGAMNEGLDINSVTFEFNGHKYDLFDDYSAAEDIVSIGLIITDLKTNEEVIINGGLTSQKGTLTNLRMEEKIKVVEDL